MKRELFEANKELRKKQNAYEEILVKLEEEYGSETGAPFVTTFLDVANLEVKIDGTVIGGIQDARQLVKDAEKDILDKMPKFPRVAEMSVTLRGKFIDEVRMGDIPVIPPMNDATLDTMTDEFINACETIVLHEMKRYVPQVKTAETFFHAYRHAVDVKLAYIRQAFKDFAHNSNARKHYEETGEFLERIETEYPWNSFKELEEAKKQVKKEAALYLKQAQKMGLEYDVLGVGTTHSINIGAERQRTSHTQRVGALRLGMIIDSPLELTITEILDDNHFKIKFVGPSGQDVECVAIMKLKDDNITPYISTLKPLDYAAYFEKHGLMDELNQDDPDVDLQDLIALNLWAS